MAEVRVRHESSLFVRLAGARIKSEWQYRTSFVSFTLAQGLLTGLEFVALVLLLEVTPTLGGWSRAEVALLYGLASVPFALADVLVSAVEDVSVRVREGTFDRLLLRPASPLVQILGDEFELRRIGKLIPTSAVLITALLTVDVDVDWTFGRAGVVGLAVACGFVIYSALFIATGAIAFWTIDSREAFYSFTYGGQSANQYPLHLYRNWLRMILGWVVPLAFVAYVPAVAILEPVNPLGIPSSLVYASPVVALAALVVALWVWRIGQRRYQSTGS